MRYATIMAASGFALAVSIVGAASAAEIRLLSSNAVRSVLEELVPQFEKASEHKLNITFGAAANLKADIEKGTAFDLAILTSSAADDLVKAGKLVAATRTDIARSGAGVAVRKGAPKPDISTTEAFKRALLNAQTIVYVEQGATGIYLKSLFERLGIAEQIKGKVRLAPTNAAEAVANGVGEIGMTQISEILPFTGAELVGPLPAEIQLHTVFPAAIGAGAKQPDAAQSLIRFLKAPAAVPVLKAKGLEPG